MFSGGSKGNIGKKRVKIVESIHKTQAGCSLEYQNIHTRYILSIYSLRQGFHKQIVITHSYLMVYIRALKYVRCKTKIRDILMSQRWSVQAEVLLPLYKQIEEPSE